jgi:hypothetical protein
MEPGLIAFLILLPAGAVFIYAAIHEYRRYKSKGSASYGLVYDEETGTTHVKAIPDGEDSYDLDDFDPSNYSVGGPNEEADDGKS